MPLVQYLKRMNKKQLQIFHISVLKLSGLKKVCTVKFAKKKQEKKGESDKPNIIKVFDNNDKFGETIVNADAKGHDRRQYKAKIYWLQMNLR